jgi:predicted permease
MLLRHRPFWYLRRRPERVAAEVDEELAAHLAMRAEELQARGLAPEAARNEARRRFGDLEYTRRYCRQQDLKKEERMATGLALEELGQDLRISLRGLLRAPVLAATIVTTVGLGMGATTVIFGAIDAALLRPLPYPRAEELVRVYTDSPPNRFRFSVADCLALDAQQTSFEMIAAYTGRTMAFSDADVAERLEGKEVTWTYLGVLGLRPVLGRDFTESDARPGAAPAVIVSHGFWQRRLGGRADAVGHPIRLDGAEHALVGVLPQAIGPLEQGQELFVVARWSPPTRRGPFLYTTIGRLRPGVGRSAAASELRAINRRIFPLWRASYQDEKATWSMMDLKAHVLGDVHTVAGVALAAVVLVWLIACANASSLLIARVTSRRRELAIRSALGASSGRVVRHLLAESSVLAAGAALLGVAIASLGMRLVRELAAGYFPRAREIALDGRAVALLAGLGVASALLFGLVPAVHGAGDRLDESLRAEGRSATGGRRVRRLRRALVTAQFAIATPMLVVAALLLASLDALGRVDLGFDGRNLVSGSIALPAAVYSEPGRIRTFWDELQRRLEAQPGVSAVAFADGRAPEDVENFNNFDLEDAPAATGQSQPVAPWVGVTPGYFRLLGLTLHEGRLFDERDGERENVEAVVVDRAWARRFFPDGSAVGKRFREGGCTACPWTTVVGVVGDVKYAGLDRPDEGTVYWPMAPSVPARYVLLRTSVPAPGVLPSVRRVLRELDPSLPLSNVAGTDELVVRSLQRPRSLTFLVGGFAIVALVLSAVGIHGVMSYYVQQHVKDVSIRLALGGSPGDILRLVVGQGMRIVASGVALGLVAALLLSRLVASLLFGVGASDASTFAMVGASLLGIALIAVLVPARRAMTLQPAVVLRDE